MAFRIVLTIVMKRNPSVGQQAQIVQRKDLDHNARRISFHVTMDSALLPSMCAMELRTVRTVLTKYLRDADHYRKNITLFLYTLLFVIRNMFY